LETVTNPAIPASWCSIDIRVGSLTLHLDEDSYLKAYMNQNDYDQMTQKFETLSQEKKQFSSP
jgi:hypothetical protein